MERGPPVAATTEVTRTMSSRLTSQATRLGRAKGRRVRTAAEESAATTRASASRGVSRPSMTGAGRSGTTTSAPAVNRPQARVPRSRFWSSERAPSAVTLDSDLFDQGDDLEDRQVQSDDQAADDDAQNDDHRRLQQGHEGAHGGIDLVVVEVGHLAQHLIEGAG